MTYSAPQIIASYSLNASIATARASVPLSGEPAIPNGDVYFIGGGYNGYVSSVMYSNGHESGNYHPFS